MPLRRPQLVGAQMRSSWRTALLALRVELLRWAVGIFCAFVGALMLIVPHQFSSPSFSVLRLVLPWIGALYLLAGMALLMVAVLAPRRRLALIGHAACGGVLLFHAYSLLLAGSLGGWPIYLVLGLGTLGAGLLPVAARRPTGHGDLFALLLGLCAISSGLVMLLLPDHFQLSIYDLIRPYLLLFALAFLGAGLAMVVVELRPPRNLGLRWLFHAALAFVFLSYMFYVSLPSRGITGLALYGGFGLTLLLQPWLGHMLQAIDTSSLRVRVGLTVVAAAALPLTLTIAIVTGQEEQIVLDQVMFNQRVLASTLAQSTADYVLFHRRAVETLAADSELLARSPDDQRARLLGFGQTYPDFFACTLYDAAGQSLASSVVQTPVNATTVAPFADTLRSGQTAMQLRISTSSGRPLVAFGAPIRGTATSTVAGMVVCGLETTRLSDTLAEGRGLSDRVIYLVDDAGRVVSYSDPASTRFLSDLSALPPVEALRDNKAVPGVLLYGVTPNSHVAGFAPLPELDWGVVVEWPLASALSSVHRARELAFGVLLFVIVGALIAGIALARYLTAPLTALARAVSQFSAGDADAPLPRVSVREVTRLAEVFGQMREELSTVAAAREHAIQQRDAFFSVAAHELKTPLTSLLGQVQLFQRRAQREQTFAERDRRSLTVIEAQSLRLNALVTDLLDVSRLQQGHLSLQLAPLDLGELVARIGDEVRPTFDRHALVLDTGGSPLPVLGDALRLEQVLQNLLNNAVKYSPEGGTVLVRLSRHGAEARVAVVDQGIGIPAAALPHVFQRFYRASNANPRQVNGMGIGLYVVHEIVTLHGGRVAVESVEGQGSTFTVGLPLAED